MSTKPDIKVDNNEQLKKFKNFLSPDDNVDILFSAPFGSGKTYFLQNDFEQETREDYNIIHLFPVNYSVSSNEDIYELIKYDILQECTAKFYNLIENEETLNFSLLLKVGYYFQNKFDIIKFSDGILKKASLICNTPEVEASSALTGIIKFIRKEWDKIKEDIEVKTEESIIEEYFTSLEEKPGIYENDKFTKFIREFLKKLKQKTEKRNILIIDDLDRIDPEHIFRLFNMFSAHKDYLSKEHKFGFDKVIFVCDINNIRKIYNHKYGDDVDFWGYISKFVSNGIYNFDTKANIREVVRTILSSYKYNNNLEPTIIFRQDYIEDINLIIYLIEMLINLERINLRDIISTTSLFIEHFELPENYNQFDIICILIDRLLGGKGKFKSLVKEMFRLDVTYTFGQSLFRKEIVELIYKRLIFYILSKNPRHEFDSLAFTDRTIKILDTFEVTIDFQAPSIKLIDFDSGAYNKFNLIKFLKENIN